VASAVAGTCGQVSPRAARGRGVLSATLQIGAVNEMVEVEAGVAMVQRQNAAMGGPIAGARPQELPLNGRNVLELARLQGDKKTREDTRAKDEPGDASAPGGHVRSYFPEALD